MLGGLSISQDGAMVNDRQSMPQPQDNNPSLRPGEDKISDEKLKEEIKKREEANFKKAENAIKDAMKDDAEMQELAKSLKMDMTPEGLRIQIIDQDGKPMFPSGSATMYERTQKLLAKVAEVIRKMPNQISVRGHTDGVPYSKGNDYTNWELSADRANASRRVLVESGFPEARVNNVVGKADTDHLVTDKPNDEQNRRISIILLRGELVTQVGANMSTKAVKEQERAAKDPLYRRSSGDVDFP
jgi:chemotaxis protein MotB